MANPFEEGRQIFLVESRDLLGQVEAALLALEASPEQSEAVDALFRAVHTIKGAAGLFAFDRVVSFTHVFESVLDRVRAGAQVLVPALMDLALRCADHIGALVDVIASTGDDKAVEPAVAGAGAALLEQLEAYLGGAAPSLAAHDTPAAELWLDEPRIDRSTWHISLRFGPGLLRDGMDPLSLLQHLRSLGTIERVCGVTDALPTEEHFDPGSCYLGCEVLLATTATAAEILDVFAFVRPDCLIHILEPRARLSDYASLIPWLPEAPERVAALLLDVGALSQAELTAVQAAPVPPGPLILAPTATSPPARPSAGNVTLFAEPPPPPPPAPSPRTPRAPAARGEAARFLRVPADKLDRLITLVGELVIAGSGASALARAQGGSELSERVATVEALIAELRDQALALRMVPVGDTFNRFARVVRDVGHELGKDIELVVSGGQTELDKSMVERINDPLTHIVRNALDHGIEAPADRLQAGKSATGRVHLRASHEAGAVVIEVSDDGKGLDPQRLLQKGRDRGLVGPNETPSEEALFGLIFEPGFSTAEKVTNLSGRGVGMDVVRRNINELRGTVSLASRLGAGTTVTLRLPLTLAIIEGFLVKASGVSYVLPLARVFECLELPEAPDGLSSDQGFMNLRGQVLPLVHLRDLFGLGGVPARRQNVVVLDHGALRVGVVVDQLLGEHQTVIKPLGPLFAAVPVISGGAVLGTGEVALLIDVPGLITRACRRPPAPRVGCAGNAVREFGEGTKDAIVQ